ncbi:MAG: DMT family transporter [Clostridium sp.]
MSTKKTLAYITLIGVVVAWGVSFVSIKVVLDAFSPVAMAFVRFLIATIALIIVKQFTDKEKVNRKDYGRLAISGIFAITLYFFFENNGILRVSANSASIIVATLPIAAIIADKIFYKTRISKVSIISIVVSMFGIYLVIGKDVISGSLSGYLYMLGSVIAWCGYLIITKPLFKKYSNITITTYQSIFGTLAFIPLLPFETINFQMINGNIVLNLLFLALICSSFGNFGYNFAFKELDVGIATLFLNLCPVVTFIFSFFILGETLRFTQIIGSIIIIGAVYIATKPPKVQMEFDDNIKKINENETLDNMELKE